jgi:hypothetical protein
MKIRSESEKINRNSIFYQSTESQLESTGVDWVETKKIKVDSSRLSHFDMSIIGKVDSNPTFCSFFERI